MALWLATKYKAIVYEQNGAILGYALFRHDADYTYLRQMYVIAQARRRGIGRALVAWMIENVPLTHRRLRIEVLINNAVAVEFWRAIGFRDYCLTMELEK